MEHALRCETAILLSLFKGSIMFKTRLRTLPNKTKVEYYSFIGRGLQPY